MASPGSLRSSWKSMNWGTAHLLTVRVAADKGGLTTADHRIAWFRFLLSLRTQQFLTNDRPSSNPWFPTDRKVRVSPNAGLELNAFPSVPTYRCLLYTSDAA